jgi:hypothetical protein
VGWCLLKQSASLKEPLRQAMRSCPCRTQSRAQQKRMPTALDQFCLMELLALLVAVLLSVSIGVGGWPVSLSAVRTEHASFLLLWRGCYDARVR